MLKRTVFRFVRIFCFGSVLSVLCINAVASTINVSVVDPNGRPVPDVVVFVAQHGAEPSDRQRPGRAVMDQRNLRFVPHVLVVQMGTTVEFPNSDPVAHHVYSFSKPNDFTLPLYKGDPHEPVTFEHDGIVALGCNVHDQMLGYIAVVDTDVFGKTGDDGSVTLSVSDTANSYSVSIWSPRIRDEEATRTQTVSASNSRHVKVKFSLRDSLRQAHSVSPEASPWSAYR